VVALGPIRNRGGHMDAMRVSAGAPGLEIMEPLTFKGRKGSGLPGGRNAYADASLKPKGGDWEKYTYTYASGADCSITPMLIRTRGGVCSGPTLARRRRPVESAAGTGQPNSFPWYHCALSIRGENITGRKYT